jgi:lipid-binding SYLF domain-containing protein
MRITATLIVLVIAAAALGGCASLGSTPAEKRATILEMRDRAVAQLVRERPEVQERMAAAAGYAVFDAASQNLILLQTEGGYGVLTSSNGETTFMKAGGAGVGFGVGLKDYREVIIFRDAEDFERFRDVGWDASGRAEATAKGGNLGGSATGRQSVDLDVITYQLLDAGIALQATVGATRYWQWRALNEE